MSEPNGNGLQGRTAMLADYAIMDSPPEPSFDDIVYLAADICEAPIATISLIDDDRQWFKARIGVDVCETGLDRSVCAHGLSSAGLLIIPDMKVDPRTAENPIVTQKPAMRFYAGAPLRTSRGDTLGMLCVVDHFPRSTGLTQRQQRALTSLARQAVTSIELHRLLRERETFLEKLGTTH